MSQLLIFKPNFLVFNYTLLELSEIREALYESYEILTELKILPDIDELSAEEMPLAEIFDQIASEIAFDDTEEYKYIAGQPHEDVFSAVFNANRFKVEHDIQTILLMDHVFFYDSNGIMHNHPNAKVW